jgi:spore coat polysaccharide biosynthesis protein SpsF (cytidylyltransferase family)
MEDRRRVAVIQARLGSTRLPRKVLADIGGVPMLLRIASRLRRSRAVDEVRLNTSEDDADDELAAIATDAGLEVDRGPVDDIVGRLASSARAGRADVLIRVWGDCPFIDPEVIDDACRVLDAGGVDFVTNCPYHDRTYPPGLDVEVYTGELLQRLDVAITDPPDREFPSRHVLADPTVRHSVMQLDRDLSALHLTVDYPEDLAAARRLAELLTDQGDPTGVAALVETLEAHTAIRFSEAPRNVELRTLLATAEAEEVQP